VDESEVRAEIEAISALPLEDRAEALERLITGLERELESTSVPAREQTQKS
jgi:hypothetical protein